VLKKYGLCEDQLLVTQPVGSPFVTVCGLSSRGHAQSITAEEETDGEEWCLKLSPSVTELDIASASPSSSRAIVIAALKWMHRLQILTLDLAWCTTDDAKSILRDCPTALKIHQRPQLGSVKPSVFPPCLALFGGRLVTFAGCVPASGVAVLAKCGRLQEVDLWFHWQQYDFKTSGAVQHDIVRRICKANIPVTSIDVWGLNDIKLVTPFKKTLQRLTITRGDAVDMSFLKPSRTRGGGLQQLHLCACDLDANSCALIVAARIPRVQFDGCILRDWMANSSDFDLAAAQRVLKPLVCESAGDGYRSIQCIPQYKKKHISSLDSKLMGLYRVVECEPPGFGVQ
jgi:hypothetical protein